MNRWELSSSQRDSVYKRRQDLIKNIWKSDWDPGTFDTDFRRSPVKDPIEQSIVRSLIFDAMDDREDLVTVAYERTFDWIFRCTGDAATDATAIGGDESTGFAKWLKAEDRSIYWITGKPGSGKSTLVKYILHHPELPGLLRQWAGRLDIEPLVAGYYFWDAGSNPLQKSREGMMRTLLYQCLSQRPDLIREITRRRWALHSVFGEVSFTPPQWTWEELNQTFALLAERSGHDFRLALFIDGLDEFDGDPKDIIRLVQNINLKQNVKICVASRPWTAFTDAFAQSPSLTMQRLTEKDILTYVHGQFETCRAYNERKAAFPEAVATLLKDVVLRAEGVFLWVSVVVRSLKEDMEDGQSPSELQAILQSLPEDITSLYTKIWQQVQRRGNSISEHLLQIKMASIDIIPLDASLLWVALGEELPEGPDNHEIIKPILTRKLDSFTRGFLELSPSGLVEFMHRTAHDWAKQMEVWKMSDLSPGADLRFDPSLALTRAANICITPRISLKSDHAEDRLANWMPIAQVLTLAGNAADRPEITSQLIDALDNFDRIMAGESNPIRYSGSHWSIRDVTRSDIVRQFHGTWRRTINYPRYENCFVGVAASFAILPYVREKISRQPQLLSRNHRLGRLSLLESAICGWNWQYYSDTARIGDRKRLDLLSQFCRGRRIEMVRFALDLGGCLETRAYLASPKVTSIRDYFEYRERISRSDYTLSELDPESKRLLHLHWSDVSSLIQSQPLSIMASLRFQCFAVPLRIVDRIWGFSFRR